VNDRRLARARHLLLRGRARAQLGLADDAADDFRAARAALASDDVRRFGLARDLAGVERARGRFDACADELDAVTADPAFGDDDAVLLATCLRATTRSSRAHDVLAGRTSPPAVSLRARARLEDGLPLLARDDVAALVPSADAALLLSFARAFRAAGDHAYARALVDVAVARFPDDADVARALASFGDGGARALRAAWLVDGLADRLRAEGRPRDAWGNALWNDGPARLRARLALLVDERAWDRVLALAPRLRAAGVIDDDVAYAIAWAALAVGRLADADTALDDVVGGAGFARATELRAVIAACRAARAGDDRAEEERLCPR
jgi:tetratricopeptide (TPR) repeat protein